MRSFSPEFEQSVEWVPPTGQMWRNLPFNQATANDESLENKEARRSQTDLKSSATINELGFKPINEHLPDIEKLLPRDGHMPSELPGTDLTAQFVTEHEELTQIIGDEMTIAFGAFYSEPDFPSDEELAAAREGIGITRGYGVFELEGIIDRDS